MTMTGWFSGIFGAYAAKGRTPPRSTSSAASSPAAKRADRTPTPSRLTEISGPPSIRRETEIETVAETVTAAAADAGTMQQDFPAVLPATVNVVTATASTAETAGIASTAITAVNVVTATASTEITAAGIASTVITAAGTATTTSVLRSVEAVQEERDKDFPGVDFGGMVGALQELRQGSP